MLTSDSIQNDTIVAVSTPSGYSGIGVVRISGPATLPILQTLFHHTGPDFPNRKAIYGKLIDPESKRTLDDGLCIFMQGPHSYTGDDVAELNLHGSPLILHEAVRLIIQCGARLAQRGEFTRRAFLAGKLNLLQAESVIDIIEATNLAGLNDVRYQADKCLADEIRALSSDLKDILAELEAHLDFDDDDLEEKPNIEPGLNRMLCEITSILDRSKNSRLKREGIRIVLIGKPNVGKSTLFNALLKHERMIVTPYPGTTRDPVDEMFALGDHAFILSDTAGLRDHSDPIEEQGIQRSKQRIQNADLVLAVFDLSNECTEDDYQILNHVSDIPALLVFNKCDLPGKPNYEDLQLRANGLGRIEISAKTGEGLDRLENALLSMTQALVDPHARAGVNRRCSLLLEEASSFITNAVTYMQLHPESWAEIVSLEIRNALAKFEEITGENVDHGILDRIFERFCVGK